MYITPEGITVLEPGDAVGSFIVTEPTTVAEDVGANFCRHVHHFTSPDSASTFAAADSRRYTLGIDQLHAAAQMLYQEAWSG
jgi:hypothetical protein